MRSLAPFFLFAFAACASPPRLRPFTTDGCTLFPDGTTQNKDLWLHCCIEHDHKYWKGGAKEDRLSADQELRACVAAVGEPKIGALMMTGVRAGGTPYLPTSWRWGYGWPYLRGYKMLTDDEKKLIEDIQR